MNVIVLIAVILLSAVFVGFVMETYKKFVRDNKASAIETRVVAFLLSVVAGFVCYEVIDLTTITTAIKDTMLVALIYGVAIYIGQYEACMKVWKPIVRQWIEKKI